MDGRIAFLGNGNRVYRDMKALFEGEGFATCHVTNRRQFYEVCDSMELTLLLLDAMFSPTTIEEEVTLIRNLRSRTNLPLIVILGEDTDETARIIALGAGADDCLSAGYHPLELLARAGSQIRRYAQLRNLSEELQEIYRVGTLEVDDRIRRVTVDGRVVKLTPIEYQILRLLVKERGRVFSIDQIYESIWNMKAYGADNTIAVHIRHIREKIENNPKQPRYLKVVWGTGYKVG